MKPLKKYKKLTKKQLEEYENKKLTSKDIVEMEQRGFKIPLIVKLNSLQEEKIEFSKNTLTDMLRFAIDREYYEKAAILRDLLEKTHPTTKAPLSN
jgi:protein-arginine kinase activator protein McsA